MVLPGHLAGGYIATASLLKAFAPTLPVGEMNALLLAGVMASELPDLDIITYYFDRKLKKTTKTSHRSYETHAPLFWLVVSLIISLTGAIAGSDFVRLFGFVILSGTWSHLILDSIEYGVMWFWPFTERRFGLMDEVPREHVTAPPGTPLAHFQFVTRDYAKTLTFWVEIVLTAIAVFCILK